MMQNNFQHWRAPLISAHQYALSRSSHQIENHLAFRWLAIGLIRGGREKCSRENLMLRSQYSQSERHSLVRVSWYWFSVSPQEEIRKERRRWSYDCARAVNCNPNHSLRRWVFPSLLLSSQKRPFKVFDKCPQGLNWVEQHTRYFKKHTSSDQ